MEITYTQKGDYLYPDLTLPPQKSVDIGRFGRMRRKYLRDHRKAMFSLLAAENKLNEHLAQINEQALEIIETITEQTAKATGVTEELKAKDQLEWIRRMNELRAAAEQQVIREIVLS